MLDRDSFVRRHCGKIPFKGDALNALIVYQYFTETSHCIHLACDHTPLASVFLVLLSAFCKIF